MKTTLCTTCIYGLIREVDYEDDLKERHFINRCILGNDYPGVITSCNRYKKMKKPKVTYHDPDFDKYIEQQLQEAIKSGTYPSFPFKMFRTRSS